MRRLTTLLLAAFHTSVSTAGCASHGEQREPQPRRLALAQAPPPQPSETWPPPRQIADALLQNSELHLRSRKGDVGGVTVASNGSSTYPHTTPPLPSCGNPCRTGSKGRTTSRDAGWLSRISNGRRSATMAGAAVVRAPQGPGGQRWRRCLTIHLRARATICSHSSRVGSEAAVGLNTAATNT